MLRACFSFPAPSGGLPTLTALDTHLSLIFLVHWSKTLYLTFLHILSLVNTPGMINSCCLCCKSIISSCPHQKTPGSFSMQDMLRHTRACVCARAHTHTHTHAILNTLYLCVCVHQSCLTLCNSMNRSLPGSPVCAIFPGKKAGMDCYFLLQGNFPTQGSNPCLPRLPHLLH